MAKKKMEHVGVMVKDLETSTQFYQDIVGMQLTLGPFRWAHATCFPWF